MSSKTAGVVLLFLLVLGFISGCAPSTFSRGAASGLDGTRQQLGGADTNPDNVDVVESYRIAGQAAKGAFVGGATGAIAGVLYPGMGVLPGTVVGALIGAGIGSYVEANMTLRDKLENKGATLVVLGDQILIVIPSARIFHPMTSTIKPQAYATLALLTQYINTHMKMLVHISGYTGDNGRKQVDQVLSQQQASAVGKFLLESGVDARVLYAEGYGATRLITKNTDDWEGNDNYRIEITLEKLQA